MHKAQSRANSLRSRTGGGKPGYDPVLSFTLRLGLGYLFEREVVNKAEDRLSFLSLLSVAPAAGCVWGPASMGQAWPVAPTRDKLCPV